MLQLKGITKDYSVGGDKVRALKGIDIAFRKSEFVSVLGPSGCGKTTLLNIIGGLDHYTDGELFIDGISTKNYSDRDWDTYRNHRIGFIFQSYNLIPHQTICENVELALTISGVEKHERLKRAKEALDKVGLKGQYNKKPNQLSGGQCQRVAIARALVNEPEILLADEPTGALDTVTSVQIMDLIREIANERLVIMVTHNPELAEKYSTRIVRLLDGNIEGDTNPFPEEEEQALTKARTQAKAKENMPLDDKEQEKKRRKALKRANRKSKLSFLSALRLSARNLLSKFKRTLLVCFAGSIGIIGVASVLAVSSGVQNYIHDMQDDMLSGNPVTVSAEALDMSALMAGMSGFAQGDALKQSVENGYINVNYLIDYLVSRGDAMGAGMIKNDITDTYVEFVESMPKEYYSAIVKTYGLNLSNNIYTDYAFNGHENDRLSLTAATQIYTSMLEKTEYAQYSAYISLLTSNFMQAPSNPDFIISQYDFVTPADKSKIATKADEIMIVVSGDSDLNDLLLAQYGYYTQDEFLNIIFKAKDADEYNPDLDKNRFTYEELIGKTFTWYPNDEIFTATGNVSSPFKYSAQADNFANGKDLKITAILKPKDGISYGCLQAGFYYPSALADEIIANGKNSEIVRYLTDHNTDAFNSGSANIGGTTIRQGIMYDYSYTMDGQKYDDIGFVGSENQMNAMLGAMPGMQIQHVYSLSRRELGGNDIPSRIAIYPTDFDLKDSVTSYLETWNGDGDIKVGDETIAKADRTKITHTDNLAIVIDLVNDMITIVTSALIAFTALSLVVSTVMIAIITYVSVIERVKEIGVIRSLGGRKRDVSGLFNAETFIIGAISGIIGIAVTYGISGILNLILGSLFGIYTIASLPIGGALIMIGISIALTLISGLIPAGLAAKKDPVDALRTE